MIIIRRNSSRGIIAHLAPGLFSGSQTGARPSLASWRFFATFFAVTVYRSCVRFIEKKKCTLDTLRLHEWHRVILFRRRLMRWLRTTEENISVRRRPTHATSSWPKCRIEFFIAFRRTIRKKKIIIKDNNNNRQASFAVSRFKSIRIIFRQTCTYATGASKMVTRNRNYLAGR